MSSGAYLATSALVSWDGGYGTVPWRDWKFIYFVVNSRAALYGSLHTISICLSRAVTEVPEPVHLGQVLLPRRRAGSPQRELLLSWKGRHRSSPPQIRGGVRSSIQVRSRKEDHFLVDYAASSVSSDVRVIMRM
jgi:hypothetical protein